MNSNWIDATRGLLPALIASTTLLVAACSATAADEPRDIQGTAAPSPAAARTVKVAVAEVTPPIATTGDPAKDLAAKGKVVFQQTAGGTGCQLCHGMEGRGDGAANLGAPNIRGADISRIRGALQGGVPVMGYIKLSEDELQAVAAFVQSLGGQ